MIATLLYYLLHMIRHAGTGSRFAVVLLLAAAMIVVADPSPSLHEAAESDPASIVPEDDSLQAPRTPYPLSPLNASTSLTLH